MPRPFRLVLANLCDDSFGYGPGASEYLRAQVLTHPQLAGRVEVKVLFRQAESPERTAQAILEAEPDVVGFSCYSWNLERTGEVSRLLAPHRSRFPIVWGGVSFALFRERNDWFDWWDCVDAVAIGSGEHTLTNLLVHLLEGGRLDGPLPGMVVHREGRLEFGPPAKTPSRLSDVASPYLLGPAMRVERPFVEMARGCRFQCAFCSDARASREDLWLTHDVERLSGEIASIVQWPEAEWIDAGASTANVTDEHFAQVCEAIRRGDPAQRLQYSFQLYPAIVRPAQREALHGLRVGKICLGYQSDTPGTWGPMRRKSTLDHLRRALKVLDDVRPLYLSLILGLPGETLDSFRRTFDAVAEYDFLHVSVHRLLILPGTQFHRDHDRLGLRFSKDRFYRVLSTPDMDADDLARAQEYVLEAAATRTPRAVDGLRRFDWTNFDIQRTAFEPASLDSLGNR